MILNNRLAIAAAFAVSSTVSAIAQNDGGITLHGSVQSDILVPETDKKIGTDDKNNDDVLTNTYVDLNMISKYVDAGARFEYLEHPLPGFVENFQPDFKGWGVPHIYVKGKYKGMELTVGDYYEQFGSGFILRTYEERSLGIDNALRGGRVKLNNIKGVQFTALAGVQRQCWDWSTDSWVYGADLEINLDEYFKQMNNNGITWMLGGSWVLKNEKKHPKGFEDINIPGTNFYANFPHNVNAFDIRTRFQKGNFSILGEYAWRDDNPCADNGYIFHKGNAVMLSASYSKTGFSALVQAKRSEDMSFRSQRGMTLASGYINNMPTFAYQHTYALAALYPYATQIGTISPNLTPGEWAFQGEFGYTFKRKTPLGGKYGTKLKLNVSHVRGLDYTTTETFHGSQIGTDGYTTKFFGMSDEAYYQDINVQLEKKFTKSFKLNFMYMNQRYNQTIVEGHGGMIKSNIFVAEGKYQFNNKMTLRAEAQYLGTKHESGDWVYGLLELSVLPHFMFTVSDMYGRPYLNGVYTDKEHYYMGNITYNIGSHRIMAGYGRTRAGYNCSGGVCRWVPASKGFQVSYNYNF